MRKLCRRMPCAKHYNALAKTICIENGYAQTATKRFIQANDKKVMPKHSAKRHTQAITNKLYPSAEQKVTPQAPSKRLHPKRRVKARIPVSKQKGLAKSRPKAASKQHKKAGCATICTVAQPALLCYCSCGALIS